MKKFKENSRVVGLVAVMILVASFMSGLTGPTAASAATTPSLGAAATFGALGSTYTNTSAGTTINGNLGYTTGPAVTPTVNGTTHVANGTYNQAGIDQGTALTNLNGQACTFTFAAGAIDLAADTTHGPVGVYTPGVYCTGAASAASIGTAGITLSGAGTYIFRVNGAFTTVVNSNVSLINGATANDVFWTPTSAATLGANSTFKGTIIDASGITIGNNVSWIGRALAFGGTVMTDADTISVPATLHVIKLVVNGSGGTAVASNFIVSVKTGGLDVSGSPAVGVAAPGAAYSLSAGTYVVNESVNTSYVKSFSGDCNSSGSVTLAAGDDKICTIVNTDIPQPTSVSPLTQVQTGEGVGSAVISVFVPVIGILKVPTPLALATGSGPVTYNYTVWNVAQQRALVDITVTDDKCSPVRFISGDLNGNGKIEPRESWKYSCTTTLSQTTTNTSVATGHSDDANRQTAIATAIATVVVGAPLPPPLINIVKMPSRLTPFPFGGGSVIYVYSVTNPGVVAMNNVTVTDDKCEPMFGPIGDANDDRLLGPGEAWVYACRTYIPVSTRNVATAKGQANGFTALGYAFATVLVSAPGLPDTGFPPQRRPISPDIVLASIFMLASVSFALAAINLRKRTI